MSAHGEILSPLQQSVDDSTEARTKEYNEADASRNFQKSNSESSEARGLAPILTSVEYSNLDSYETDRERSKSNSSEIDPSAAFPGLNQLAGIVPTAATFTNFVPNNANDALVTVMPWMEEEKELLPHQEAAILLEFARDGQDLNGSKLSLRSRLCYRIRRKYHWVFRAAAWALLLIHVFQRPVWTRKQNKAMTWDDSSHFPSWELSYLNYTSSNVLILLALLANWIGVGLELGYKRNTSNAYQVYASAVILFVKSVFNFTNFILIGQNLPNVSCSPIEGFLVLLIELQYDNSLSFLIRAVPKFAALMVGMAIFVMIYTALGMMIFNPEKGEGQTVFKDYGVALWNMAMVLNGANWPGPMIPAIVSNRFFVTYFYVFLMLVVWGLLNIVLGFNYLFFQSEQKTISDMQEKTRVDNKAEAFRILDIEKKGFLSYEQVDVLLKEMYEFYEELSDVPSFDERHELILALDIQSNNMIDENDFHFIEQKCFQGALKHLRAKKRKFTRYISAHIIKEQSEQLMKEQTDKLKQATAKVGLKIGEEKESVGQSVEMSDNISIHASPRGDTRGAYAGLEEDTSPVKNPLVHPEESATSDARAEGHTEANEGTNHEDSVAVLSEEQQNALAVQTRDLKQARADLIEAAARYAGMFRDPKLVAWYHTMGNRQIEALSKARGRTFGQVVSHFAMQVDSIYFDIFSDTVIVGIGIALLLHKPHPSFAVTYNVFTLSEMVVKFLVKGYHRYVSSNRSSIDGRIALSLLVMNIVGAVVPAPNHTQVVVKTLVLIRTLLYPRNLIVTNGFKSFRNRQRVAFTYAFGSMDHFAFLLLVLVAMMYVFSGVGLQIFGGMIDRQSNRVANSDYAALGYWPLNFNDIPSGMVTMFTLLSVNDMNVTTSGFVAALSQWAEVFFILWYCLGVLFLLNICTAVFLNQFIGYLEHLSTERQAAKEAEQLEYDQQQQAQFELEDALRKQFGDEYGPEDGAGRYAEDDGDNVPSVVRAARSDLQLRASQSLSFDDDQDERNYGSGLYTPPPMPSPQKPAWMGGVGASDHSFMPEPEYHEDSTRRQSTGEGNVKAKGLMGSAGALFSDASHKTSSALLGTTASANALLTDTTDLAKDLVHVSTSGLTSFVRLFTIDESEENAQGTAASDRRASMSTGMPMSNSSTHSHSPVRHRMSTSSSVPSSVRAKRGSQFTALATMAEEEEEEEEDDREEDLGGLEEVMRQDEEEEGGGLAAAPAVVIGPSASFSKSIFTTDEDRYEIDAWVNSRRKKRGNRVGRSRVNSFGTTTVRSRANTHSSGTRSRGNTSSSAPRSRVNTLTRSRTNTSVSATPDVKDRGKSLDWDAADSTAVASPSADQATNPLHEEFTAEGVEMSPKVKGFLSIGQSDEDTVAHSQDYKLMSFYDWFYKEDQVTPVEEAAVLLQGAIDGDDPELFTSRRGLWCFQKRTQYGNLFKVCAMLYSLLKFFQRPTWTFNEPEWNNSTYFPVSGMPQWSPAVTGSLKIPLLIVMFFGLWLEVGYQDAGFGSMFHNITWKRTKRYLLLFYCVVQFCLVLYSFGDGSVKLVALTSCGSMLYVMWFVRRSFRKARIIAKVVPPLSKVLALYLLIICIFSGFGPFLYNIENVGADDDVATEYFSDFRTATWSIFIAISTSSYPNQIMPAYREYREFAVFFFLFVTIGTLVMLNLIIAIVFVEFQKASLISSEFQRTVRKVLLMESFETLDVDEMDYIDANSANALINELHAHYPAFRKAGRPDGPVRYAFIAHLDADEDGRITMEDYLKIPDIAKTKMAAVPGPTFMELWFPKIVEGNAFQFLKRCVLYQYTNLIFDCTIAIFTVTSMAVNANNLFASTPSSVALGAVQMAIMVIEAAVKLMVRGWSRYRRSFRNQLDFTITCCAFIAVLGASGYDKVSGFTLARRTLLVFRLFWLPRNIRYVLESKSIKTFAKLCWRIVGKTLTLGVVFLCILYAFSSIGLFAFGGLINRDPNGPRYDELMNSRYAADGYWPLNFNDFTSSLITVFCCLHVSDFDVITEGITVASNKTARLFFAAWYVVGVLLMLNILKSFFLDEFLNVFNAAVSNEKEPPKEIENAPPNEGLVNHETEIDIVNPIVQGLPTIEEGEVEKEPSQSIEEQVFNPLRDSAAAEPLPVHAGPPPDDTNSLQANIFSPEKPKRPKRGPKPASMISASHTLAPIEEEADLLNMHVTSSLVGTPPRDKEVEQAEIASPEMPPRKPKRESKPLVVDATEGSLLGPEEPAVLPPPPPVMPAPATTLPPGSPALPPPPLPGIPPLSPVHVPAHVPEYVPYSEVDEAVADDYLEVPHADHEVDILPLVPEEGELEEESELNLSTRDLASVSEEGVPALPPSLPPVPPSPTSSPRHVPDYVPYSEVNEAVADDYVEVQHADHAVEILPQVAEGEMEEEEPETNLIAVEEINKEVVEEIEALPVKLTPPAVPPPLPPVPPPPVPPPMPAAFDTFEYLEEIPEEEEERELVAPVDLPAVPPPPPPVPPMPPVSEAPPTVSSVAVGVSDSLLDFDLLDNGDADAGAASVVNTASAAGAVDNLLDMDMPVAGEPNAVEEDSTAAIEGDGEGEGKGEGAEEKEEEGEEAEALLAANVSVRGRSSSGMGTGKSNKKKKSKGKK